LQDTLKAKLFEKKGGPGSVVHGKENSHPNLEGM
jgi:hypothetical protein